MISNKFTAKEARDLAGSIRMEEIVWKEFDKAVEFFLQWTYEAIRQAAENKEYSLAINITPDLEGCPPVPKGTRLLLELFDEEVVKRLSDDGYRIIRDDHFNVKRIDWHSFRS